MARNERETEKEAGQENKRPLTNEEAREVTEQVARESFVQSSNGNRTDLDESKPGSAQRGGPDLDKAKSRQPPEATRPFEEDK